MKKTSSITKRLTIGLVSGVVLFWLSATLIAGLVVQYELNEAFDQSLEQAAIRLLPLAIHDIEERAEGEVSEEYRIASLENFDSRFTYYIRDENGNKVTLPDDFQPDIQLQNVPDGFSDISAVRYFAITDLDSGFGIVIAENTDHRIVALWESVLALILPLAALIPMMIIGILYAIKKAMMPIKALQDDIAKRDGSNLAPLSSKQYPNELAPISEAVASLLERLGKALNAERAFAASSAHELRTPLAGALAQVQRLALELENGNGQQRIADIEKSLKHLSDLSEKLLQLSRTETGFAKSESRVKLIPILKLLLDDFSAGSKHMGQIVLHNPDDVQLYAKITQDAFAIIIRNLVENARKHGAPDKPIYVAIESEISFSVINDSPIISTEILQRLDQPFVRGETSAKGTGLGLSIVKSILDQCGGDLELVSPCNNEQGFKAVVHLN
ncbi:HAMP domain-containing sensor histidine kinase [Lentilitoribacter sp. Alg239-R112]|uniref:sensor histidine kinase n=1 Tax=Lentilitoribacter sp. Alg239-R112 TaxID=2305987 RepID=UPI0013A6C3C0|nr:HAMP domain-containing sensor histidine kinase [Lentilitoribacter sp. Alg239-R112]